METFIEGRVLWRAHRTIHAAHEHNIGHADQFGRLRVSCTSSTSTSHTRSCCTSETETQSIATVGAGIFVPVATSALASAQLVEGIYIAVATWIATEPESI